MPPLTQSRLKELLAYDPATGVFTWRSRAARAVTVGSEAGSINDGGYRRIVLDRHEYLAHRLAWLYVHGIWPVQEIDHRNGVCDDNRIAELREASDAENGRNRKRMENNTSGRRGVGYRAKHQRWQARICCNGTRKHLGYFRTLEAASAAYEAASTELFGEFKRQAP